MITRSRTRKQKEQPLEVEVQILNMDRTLSFESGINIGHNEASEYTEILVSQEDDVMSIPVQSRDDIGLDEKTHSPTGEEHNSMDIHVDNNNTNNNDNDSNTIKCPDNFDKNMNENQITANQNLRQILEAINQQSKEIKTEIHNLESRLTKKLEASCENKIRESEEKISAQIAEFKENVVIEFAQIREDHEHLQSQVNKNKHENNEKTKEINCTISNYNEKINEITNSNKALTNNFKKQLKDIELKLISQPIAINNNRAVEPIKINLDISNPVHFITQLDFELKCKDITDWENIRSIINNNLDHNRQASAWWNFIEESLNGYEEFKNAFKEKFWNNSVQSCIRTNLFFGKYNSNRQTMTDYFLYKFNTAKYLEPPLRENEIVKLISSHFDSLVSRARIAGRIETAIEFISLLDELQTDVEQLNHTQYKQNQNFEYKYHEQRPSNKFNHNNPNFTGNRPFANYHNPINKNQNTKYYDNARKNYPNSLNKGYNSYNSNYSKNNPRKNDNYNYRSDRYEGRKSEELNSGGKVGQTGQPQDTKNIHTVTAEIHQAENEEWM